MILALDTSTDMLACAVARVTSASAQDNAATTAIDVLAGLTLS